MPQFAIIIYSDPTAEHDAAEQAEHDRHSNDLIASGALDAAYALDATEVKAVRGDHITDGPYAETKEIIAGIGIIEAADLDAALTIARANPAGRHGSGVEVRAVEFAYLRPTGDTADLTEVTDVTDVTAG